MPPTQRLFILLFACSACSDPAAAQQTHLNMLFPGVGLSKPVLNLTTVTALFTAQNQTILTYTIVESDPGLVVQACPPGRYSPANASTCANCSANTWSDTAYPACQACPNRSTSPGAGPLAGCQCNPGYHANYTTSPFQCSLCPSGTWAGKGFAVCQPCFAGTYSSAFGATDASNCSNCIKATYSLDFASACQACPAGTYGTAQQQSQCTLCAPGTWSPSGVSICSACSAGTYSTAYGLSDQSLCPACSPGTFQANPASTFCFVCPAGSYTPTTTACATCGSNTFSLIQSGTCLACPTNSLGPGGTDAQGCICNAGYYPFYRYSSSADAWPSAPPPDPDASDAPCSQPGTAPSLCRCSSGSPCQSPCSTLQPPCSRPQPA